MGALPSVTAKTLVIYGRADEVDKILDKKLLGYRSRAEFVAEAIRDKLIQVRK